ncbi:MAG: 4'-phosphopantetheinyl transferase superfamily protein [Clostridia bacterium]|nr:4'-phosphopantetheinyl transferase superfamily protein [Clostridia bacterium]
MFSELYLKTENSEFLDVYIAALPRGGADASLIEHEGRREELLLVKNERLFLEKFYSWRLLEKALGLRFAKTPSELGLAKNAIGAWTSPYAYVSISHSGGALAVAVSSAPVGVDVEKVGAPRSEKFAERMLNERELSLFCDTPDGMKSKMLMRLWTMKEALFKASGKERFVPRFTDTSSGASSRVVLLGEECFVVSYASSLPDKIGIRVTQL